jgi:hypothetical protein
MQKHSKNMIHKVNAVCKGQTLRMTVKKSTTVTRKYEGAISDMEKLLKM